MRAAVHQDTRKTYLETYGVFVGNSRLGSEQAVAGSDGGGLATVSRNQLAQHLGHIPGDRARADAQGRDDLRVGAAPTEED